MISLQVLESLLSTDAERRQVAEAHFRSTPVDERVLMWPAVWEQAATNTPSSTALPHMIAVLWRRDILTSTSNSNLGALLGPLQQIFCSTAIKDDKIRGAFGHCLAEVVALVQTGTALEQTLQGTEALLQTHPGPVLELYQGLAQAIDANRWNSSTVSWMLDRIQHIHPIASSAGGFSTAASMAKSNHRTVQVVDTLAALAPCTSEKSRLEAMLQSWLMHTTDVDTLSHIMEMTHSFGTLSDAFWQAAWQQVHPHAGSEPRLVCQALEHLVPVLTQQSQVVEATQMLIQILARTVDEDTEEWEAVEWLEADSYEMDHDDEDVTAFAMDILHSWLAEHASILPIILQMVQSPDTSNWRSVWTTLTVWQACLTALPMALEPYAPTLYQGLCQAATSSNSSHVRVRHQAWQTMAGLLQTYPHVLTDKDGLANAVRMGLMDTSARVTAVVCRVLTSLAALSFEEKIWNQPQLDVLLQGLTQGPLSTNASCRLVVVRGLRAVAALSRSAPFGTFYAPTMLLLLQWSEREASLTGDALQAASLVAQSLVDDEILVDRVRSDAQALMERLLLVLPQVTEREPLLSACARLACVLEDKYQPYLPTVLQLLLEKVMAKDEIEFGEGDADGLDQTRRCDWKEDTITVAVPGRGLTKVTLHTSQIEEKAQAIRALYELLTALPSAWAPYMEATWHALEPLLSYTYHADIRTTAAQSMAALIEAGFSSDHAQVWGGCSRVATIISDQLINEANTEPEEWFAIADSLSEVLFSVFTRMNECRTTLCQYFTEKIANHVVQNCCVSLQNCLQRRASLAVQMSKSNSPDEQANFQEQLQGEQKFMTPLVDSIGYTLKILGPAFAPLFEQKVAPLLGPFLNHDPDTRARWSAVCLFDDCIEHCGRDAATRFAPDLLPAALSGMKDTEDQDLRQVSIYGIAQIARYAPASVLAPHVNMIISELESIASQPKDSSDNAAIHENCVSALGSLVLFPSAPFRGKYLKAEMATKILLDNMPLTMDYDEAKICSAGLCDLVESASIPLGGYTKSLIRVIGETLALVSEDEVVATEPDCARMADILATLQREGSASDIEEAFSSLSQESQVAVQSALQRYSWGRSHVVTP